MTTNEELREAVARIVDPDAMDTVEDLAGDYRQQFPDWTEERVREVAQFAYDSGKIQLAARADALTKADAILALIGAERLALLDEVERKNEALRKIESWFRDYARQHRAKGTSDGNLKADTNDERADFARTALSEGQKS